MAYKFQLDDAILSGSLAQEGNIDIIDSGVLQLAGSTAIDASKNATLAAVSGSGNLSIAGTVSTSNEGFTVDADGDLVAKSLTGLGLISGSNNLHIAGTVSTSNAGFTVDADGDLVAKSLTSNSNVSGSGNFLISGSIAAGDSRFTVSDAGAVATTSTISGTLLASFGQVRADGGLTMQGTDIISAAKAIANVTSIDASGDLTVGTITMDEFTVAANGNTDIDGTLNVEGVPTFQAGAVFSGGVTTANAIAGATTITGSGLLTMNDLSITQTALFSGDVALSGASEAVVSVADDSIYFLDATSGKVRRDTFVDYAAKLVESEPGLGSAGGKIQFDPNSLASGSINVAQDFFAFVDADDTDIPKKDSIVDLVAAMAGAGLTATAGVLSTDGGSVTVGADGGTLSEGYNYFTGTVNATVKLPAGPSVGDVVVVKAGNTAAGQNITIEVQGSHLIDGDATNIHLESPFAAVSLVYVVANDWRIV